MIMRQNIGTAFPGFLGMSNSPGEVDIYGISIYVKKKFHVVINDIVVIVNI